ncbi:MAG: DUF5837 family cyanobactin class RiPP [Xenococcaceae cyanobacterium]
MDFLNLQPKQKAPVVRPTTITPPQLSEEQLTAGIEQSYSSVGAAASPCHAGYTTQVSTSMSFDGDDGE